MAEFWRAPDSQIGFIWTYLTLGQILSFLMLAAGIVWLIIMKRFNP